MEFIFDIRPDMKVYIRTGITSITSKPRSGWCLYSINICGIIFFFLLIPVGWQCAHSLSSVTIVCSGDSNASDITNFCEEPLLVLCRRQWNGAVTGHIKPLCSATLCSTIHPNSPDPLLSLACHSCH